MADRRDQDMEEASLYSQESEKCFHGFFHVQDIAESGSEVAWHMAGQKDRMNSSGCICGSCDVLLAKMNPVQLHFSSAMVERAEVNPSITMDGWGYKRVLSVSSDTYQAVLRPVTALCKRRGTSNAGSWKIRAEADQPVLVKLAKAEQRTVSLSETQTNSIMATRTPSNLMNRLLLEQWSNPSDIYTILMIIGGEIVHAALAQLCAGPIQYLTPASFSFGCVSYAISAVRSAIGHNRLMPKPENDCKLINLGSGYSRTNYSWILSRLLRDFEHWCGEHCRRKKQSKQDELRAKGDSNRLPLRISVWTIPSSFDERKYRGDWVYWSGVFVSIIQLAIATIPWAVWSEWGTFLFTAAGTSLAYANGLSPQWKEEKKGTRTLKKQQRYCLTVGNGADEAIVIVSEKLDLEALAGPQKVLTNEALTKFWTISLAFLWLGFLITVAGWQQHTWFLLGVGTIGMVHNILVAGVKRHPSAWGLDLIYCQTFTETKTMETLMCLEEYLPGAGASLLTEFFPGKLWPREKLIWQYAQRRREEFDTNQVKWSLPPLRRKGDNADIPQDGPYRGPDARGIKE